MNNLYQQARDCLLIADPDEKMTRTMELFAAGENGTLEWAGLKESEPFKPNQQ